MDNFFPKFLDRFFRKHPRIMAVCMLLLAVAALGLVMAQSGKALVLYAGF